MKRRGPVADILAEEGEALDMDQMIEQTEQVGAGRDARLAYLRFRRTANLAGDGIPEVVEEAQQYVTLAAAGCRWRPVGSSRRWHVTTLDNSP
ncbi:Uncharacterised protein [Mycolicibacterium vanbaalenii]|uniref:Uncharacterized protein n=1 Tax=Mycolicibacterium vanbaalenii TaxID=110539 RepID=A0A5S9QLS1_MYCVN|nr:Uncharacterised protein [Mycolicibacterium vanbaalenii]